MKPKFTRKTCSFCPTDFSASTFQGCDKLFCHEHGLLHHSKMTEKSLLRDDTKEYINQKRLLLVKALRVDSSEEFRCCQECVAQILDRRPTYFTNLKLIIAILLIALAVLTRWLVSSEDQCPDGSITTATQDHCFRIQPLTPAQHIKHLKFQDSKVRSVTLLGINRNKLASASQSWKVRFSCQHYFQGGIRLFSGDRLIKDAHCTTEACPPDGQSYVNFGGRCIRTDEYASRETKCPKNSLYSQDKEACLFASCPMPSYRVNLETQQCEKCPPFTLSESSPSCLLVRNLNSNFYLPWNGFYAKVCPVETRPLTMDQRSLEAALGYYPRVIDELGYWGCPSKLVVEDSQSRECRWEEMSIRSRVRCRSPCTPCSERWNFFSRSCQALSKKCSSEEERTWSGECLRTLESVQLLLELEGDGFCL